VREGTDLSPSEKIFLHHRLPKCYKALESNFDITTPLKLGFCASGGGNRAMLTTLGAYLGMQDIGLFDTLVYSAGVSGSTWTIAPWSYLYATQKISIEDFKNTLVESLHTTALTVGGKSLPPMISLEQRIILMNSIKQRFAYNQPITSIDLYGAFLGNYSLQLAGDEKLSVTWSSIADALKQGDMPMPMGSAVSYVYGQSAKKQSKEGQTQYYWFEVSPFEVGGDQVGAYVPTKYFGSEFYKGSLVDTYTGTAPEYPLCYFQGVFGSAFAASLNEIIDRCVVPTTITIFGKQFPLPIGLWIRKTTAEYMRDVRFYAARFFNYAYGIADSSIGKMQEIKLYDGAMHFNFPLPVLMRPAREIDCIFLCDASRSLLEIQKADVHCKKNGMKFPDISWCTQEMLESKLYTIFNDPDDTNYRSDVVTIFYFPLIKNEAYSKTFDPVVCSQKGHCNTFNFKYSKKQAEDLVGAVRFNVNQMKPEITRVLKKLSQQKSMKQVAKGLASQDMDLFIDDALLAAAGQDSMIP
jgi:phospholipase A2